MEERIVSVSKYNEIFTGYNSQSNDAYYSFVPLEIEYLEGKRKEAQIKISEMKNFCALLDKNDAIARIELNSNDIAEALDNPDFENSYVSQRMNPYRLAAIITLQHREYPAWSDDVFTQYREHYE